jgi:hypothetical protein
MEDTERAHARCLRPTLLLLLLLLSELHTGPRL